MANKKVHYEEKIIPHSVGFAARQILFFEVHSQFKLGEVCREAVDEQIRRIDRKFLSEKELKDGQ